MDTNVFEKVFQTIFDERGHANVLVAGRNDDEMSTLINSVFQGDFATSGQSEMLSRDIREVTREEFPLSIFEVQGLEKTDFTDRLKELEKLIAERNDGRDEKKHIHVAWICIVEGSHKIGETETEFVEMLSKYTSVVGVISAAKVDRRLKVEVKRLLPQLRNIIGVRTNPEQGDNGNAYNLTDLGELARSSVELIPESQKLACVVTQKVNCKLKHDHALKTVSKNALLAAGAGAIPIPVVGDVALLPVQARMLAKISSVYIISFSSAFLSTMVTSIVGGAIAALTGRLVVGSVAKLIPGVGSVVGATTAAALTTGLGATYISILNALCAKNAGESPSEEEILGEIEKRFKKKKEDGDDPEFDPGEGKEN